MKIIFLDIDGVLNYLGCSARAPSKCLGIEEKPLKLLKHIEEETHANIVLTSTWKTTWEKTEDVSNLTADGKYLISKFEEQHLDIIDKTHDTDWSKRGEGILDYIKKLPEVPESIVIIDDESFDFNEVGLSNYFVKTSFYDRGLTEKHVKQAIDILNERGYEL